MMCDHGDIKISDARGTAKSLPTAEKSIQNWFKEGHVIALGKYRGYFIHEPTDMW